MPGKTRKAKKEKQIDGEKETNGIAVQDSYLRKNQGYTEVLDYSRHDDDLRASRLSVP